MSTPAVRPIRLDEPVARLAEKLAGRYNVTVPQLIEAVLIDWAEREASEPLAPACALTQRPSSRQDRRVIDLNEARLRGPNRRKTWKPSSS
jgi:hypothetical protein